MIRIASIALLTLLAGGCSSLGLSLYPEGHFLTNQATELLDNAPTRVSLPRELDASVLPSHYLQPGDVLLIEPVSLETSIRFPADQRVLLDGTIDLGKYGRVIVAGLTLESAEQLIEQTIALAEKENQDFKDAQVNVQLLDNVHRFYVLGEVASPGSYPLVGFETVLDGIVAAGGLTEDSAPCKILLARPTPPPSCRVVLPICYREIAQLGDTTTNYQLQPGDRIFVASRSHMDEIFFWRANRTCNRCRGCQTACCDPSVATFRNPFSMLFSGSTVQPSSFMTGAQVGISDLETEKGAGGEDDAQQASQGGARPTVPRLSLPQIPEGGQGLGELEFDTPIPGPIDE